MGIEAPSSFSPSTAVVIQRAFHVLGEFVLRIMRRHACSERVVGIAVISK